MARKQAVRRRRLLGLLTPLLLCGLWEMSVRTGLLQYQFLPAPSDVVVGIGTAWSSDGLAASVAHTVQVTIVGWIAAVAFGAGSGLLLGLSRIALRYSMASVELMRAIPPVTLVPVAILLWGFSVQMELSIVIFASAWPVLINTIGGIRGVPTGLLETCQTLRLSKAATVRKVILPAAAPTIVTGARLALSMSLVVTVLAEMVGNPVGLGHALVAARQALRPSAVFAYVVVLGFFGVVLNAGFQFAVSRLLPAAARGVTRGRA